MPTRYYSSVAQPALLASDPGAAGTTLTMQAAPSGWPGTAPYLLVIERGSANEELVLLTAMPTTATCTVTRGYDGSTAKAHAAGSKVEHVTAAVDFRDFQAARDNAVGQQVSRVGTDGPNLYPQGISMQAVGGNASWPIDYGQVLTVKGQNYCMQWALRFDGSARPNQLWWRSGILEATNTWGAWRSDGQDAYEAALGALML